MKKSSRGFTLVELILTITIGSVIVLGIVLFTRTQFEQSVRSNELLAGINLARLKMADMDRQVFASIPAVGSTVNFTDPTMPGFIMRLNVTLVESGGAGGNFRELRQLEILVDRTGGDYSKPLARLITYRQNGTSFGNGT